MSGLDPEAALAAGYAVFLVAAALAPCYSTCSASPGCSPE
jgi:hypothetical protein